MPRSDGQSHRLAGSWAYDHGVAADLSRNASTRVNVLTIVSAIRQSVLACAADRGWPDLRLRELRVCAQLACEMHRRFRLRKRQLSPESKPYLPRIWSVPRDARGVTPLAETRFASANHSAHCFGSSAHPSFLERGRHSFRAGQNGKGLRARRESSDSGEPLAVRNADRGSVPRNFALERIARSHRLRAVCTRDATTRSITVASATVWLLGRNTK